MAGLLGSAALGAVTRRRRGRVPAHILHQGSGSPSRPGQTLIAHQADLGPGLRKMLPPRRPFSRGQRVVLEYLQHAFRDDLSERLPQSGGWWHGRGRGSRPLCGATCRQRLFQHPYDSLSWRGDTRRLGANPGAGDRDPAWPRPGGRRVRAASVRPATPRVEAAFAQQPAARQRGRSFTAASTSSTWPSTFTPSHRRATLPSAPIRYVVRTMPMYLRP